jgi:hypothetical protein
MRSFKIIIDLLSLWTDFLSIFWGASSAIFYWYYNHTSESCLNEYDWKLIELSRITNTVNIFSLDSVTWNIHSNINWISSHLNFIIFQRVSVIFTEFQFFFLTLIKIHLNSLKKNIFFNETSSNFAMKFT